MELASKKSDFGTYDNASLFGVDDSDIHKRFYSERRAATVACMSEAKLSCSL